MPFNPLLPANGSVISAPELRSQFTGLHDEIAEAIPITGAQVDSTNTGSPGGSASASVSLSGEVLHFSFEIPAGQNGEVTQSQLSNDLSNNSNFDLGQAMSVSSANSNGVNLLNMSISDPPTQGEVQTIASKLDELINALRR